MTPATPEFWKSIKYFSPNEKKFGDPTKNAWGDPYKIDQKLILLLDSLREYVGTPIYVHTAYETSGHATDSQHYLGMAVDCHIKGMSLIDQYLTAERFAFGGIGIYPHWSNEGLHLDTRDLPNGIGARWYRNASGVYQQLNGSVLKKILEG